MNAPKYTVPDARNCAIGNEAININSLRVCIGDDKHITWAYLALLSFRKTTEFIAHVEKTFGKVKGWLFLLFLVAALNTLGILALQSFIELMR